mmetsp:Transcript_28924/g.74242  ORF Transcript_28924/g.74242 Transcript_28924/m.74242 type:complete len:216 (-) Transcript_28924:1215-1862(-)
MKAFWVSACLLLFISSAACSSIPFDQLRQATVTAILGTQDKDCDTAFASLTSNKCFQDLVILSHDDQHFFFPLIARHTPECFDFASYVTRIESYLVESVDASFFRREDPDTTLGYSSAALVDFVFINIVHSDIAACSNRYKAVAGTAINSLYSGVDVSPEDVEEWKQLIADNIDMLEEKYSGDNSTEETAMDMHVVLVVSVLVVGLIVALLLAFL